MRRALQTSARNPDRVVVAKGDRCWRSANRGAAAGAEAACRLLSLVPAAAQQAPPAGQLDGRSNRQHP